MSARGRDRGADVARRRGCPRLCLLYAVPKREQHFEHRGGERGDEINRGDEIIRGALRGLELDLTLDGAAFAFRRAPALEHRVVLRESTARDARALGEIDREHAVLFKHPKTLVAEIDHVAVGIVTRADIDRSWTEVRVAVHQPHRGYGFGASILATAADQLEAKEGRLICARMHVVGERIRHTLSVPASVSST